MKIDRTNLLSKDQKKQIEELQKICNDIENLESKAFLLNEINFDKTIPCFFLGYEDSKLISFLTIFIPQKQEAEISAFTHPDYRKKGHFYELLEETIKVLKNAEVSKILFLIEPNSNSGKEVLKKFPSAKWNRSEYTLSNKNKAIVPVNQDLTLKLVSSENKAICLKLTEEIFNMSEGENENFIQNAINAPDREAYIAYCGQEPIGIFNLNYEDNTAFIYGLGISHYFQQKGYGKKMLKYVLNKVFMKADKAILDVDSDNPSAYNLYVHNGFKVDFQIDYFLYDYRKYYQGDK